MDGAGWSSQECLIGQFVLQYQVPRGLNARVGMESISNPVRNPITTVLTPLLRLQIGPSEA